MQLFMLQVLIILTFVLPNRALAETSYSETWRQSVPAKMQGLPEGVLKWYIAETDYLSRNVDPLKIYSPHENKQDPFFKPESKNVFDVRGVWIPVQELKVYESPSGRELQKRFSRFKNGRREILFLIHPESTGLYQKWLGAGYEQEFYNAAATSSSRSLLIWKSGEEDQPLIAKLSLDKEIGGVNRSIKGSEIAMSIGVSTVLEGSNDLPENFLFMKESLSAIPGSMRTGGMILREFPPEMLKGLSHFIPLFALYGDKNPGYLLWLLQNSRGSTSTVLRDTILRPFAEVWAELAFLGILNEPHAQNVLLEIKDDRPTGRFLFRDFGGFTVDLKFRAQSHLFAPSDLPTFSGSVAHDYYVENFTDNIKTGLAVYFEGGFLFNVEEAVKKWVKMGWIAEDKSFNSYTLFQQELVKVLKEKTGAGIKLGAYYAGLDKFILKNRSHYLKSKMIGNKCSQVLSINDVGRR